MNELTIKERNIREALGSSKFAVVHPTKGEIFFSGYRFECNAFILGYNMSKKEQEQLQAKRDLWTNYEARFEVMEQHGLDTRFYVYDHAHAQIVGDQLFQYEEDADDFKEDLIKEEKEQERYYNQSGR
jgi:hypothetical protein